MVITAPTVQEAAAMKLRQRFTPANLDVVDRLPFSPRFPDSNDLHLVAAADVY